MRKLIFNSITSATEIKRIIYQTELNNQNNVFASGHWHFKSTQPNCISYTNTDQNNYIQQAIHFKITNKFGFSIAEIAGEPNTQYNDAINNSSGSVDEFLQKCLEDLESRGIDALNLHNVKEDAHIYKYCYENGHILEKKHAPWINLTTFENFDSFFTSTSKTTRKVYRRLFREFDVQYQVFLDEQISEDLIDKIINLKVKQLAKLGKSSRVFMNQNNLDDLKAIFTNPNDDYKIFVSTLKCNGALVSGAISFIKHDTYYGYIVAMDDEYTKYSPGNAHVILNVQWSFENNLDIYDFLSPADEYKFKWTKNNSTPVFDIIIPMTLRGKIFGSVYLTKIRPKLKILYLFFAKLLNRNNN